MIDCTAALLAGGKSTRMGQDKALLQIGGKPLWQIQRDKLASFADEVLISAREGMIDAKVVTDRVQGLGPLGGLQSVMEVARYDRIVILGVDMPSMTAAFLKSLWDETTPECGIVPMLHGWFEGLAAIYPRCILPVLKNVLEGKDHSMRALLQQGIERGMMKARPVLSHEEFLFQNWNRPNDYIGFK